MLFLFLIETNSVLSELTSISIKEQFSDCTLSEKFVENISSYQYSHFEFDDSIDWIEGDLKNYLKSSNSKIIIPLFHKSKLLGILCIGEKFMSEKFTDIDYKILEIISNHLTEALFNYELIENVEQKKRELNIKLLELETLFDIGVAISSVLDVNELAEDVLFRAIGVLNASKGMFIRQNDQSPILDILSMFNWGDSKFLLSKKIDVLNKINDGESGLILTSNDKTELQKKLKEDNLLVVPLRS